MALDDRGHSIKEGKVDIRDLLVVFPFIRWMGYGLLGALPTLIYFTYTIKEGFGLLYAFLFLILPFGAGLVGGFLLELNGVNRLSPFLGAIIVGTLTSIVWSVWETLGALSIIIIVFIGGIIRA